MRAVLILMAAALLTAGCGPQQPAADANAAGPSPSDYENSANLADNLADQAGDQQQSLENQADALRDAGEKAADNAGNAQ